MLSSGKSELTATKEFECSRVSPITSEQHAMSSKGSSSLTTTVVASKGGQHSSSGSRLVPKVSPATILEQVLTLIESRVSKLVSLSSPVASEKGEDDFVG